MTPSATAVVVVLLLLACACRAVTGQQDDESTSHSSHDHDESSHESHDEEGGTHFEAAAVYDVETAGTNSLVVVPGTEQAGSFEEDMSLAFMVVPAATADAEGLEEAEEDAEGGA